MLLVKATPAIYYTNIALKWTLMYTVYMHIAPNCKRYIGITCQNPDERWKNGTGYKRNKHFYSAIERYGWSNIRHEIVAEGLTKAQACAMEIKLIAEYDTTNRDKGYNHSTGGEYGALGHSPSAEARRKISEANKNPSAEVRRKISEANRGKHLSAETRRKMSKARKGRIAPNKGKHHTAETKRKISEAEKGRTSPIKGKHLSVETRRKMSEAKKGHAVSAETRRKIGEAHSKPVVCVETGKQYASATEAAKAIGIRSRMNICSVCRGTRKTCGGYHWKYAEENGESK